MGNNAVPVLETLIFISYAKLLRTVIVALSYSVLETEHGRRLVWSADGNMDYLGQEHILLFVVAVIILVILHGALLHIPSFSRTMAPEVKLPTKNVFSK